MNDSLEDYDFTPSSSNNLRSLFDTSPEFSEKSSLIYTAPKQPKVPTLPATQDTKSEATKVETSVICARVVQLWKLIEGKYTAIGKHGCAIIGSSTQNSYEIILYKEKHNVVARVKICENFEISLKKDSFASFYDSAKDNWLLKFNTLDDSTTMVNHIKTCGGKVISVENKNTTASKTEEAKFIEDGDNPENKAKTDILTRIAKMGQSILPNKSLESEEDSFDGADTKVVPHVDKVKTVSQKNPSSALTPTNILSPESTHTIPNTFVITQPMAYDPLNIFMAENRTQNSEIRMNLSHISEKLNCIMNFVETGKHNSSEPNNNALKSKIKVLELRTENLLKELQNIEQENAKLKSIMEQQETSLKNEEKNKSALSQVQEQQKTEIAEFQQQIVEHKNNNEKLSQIIETKNSEIVELQLQLESHQKDRQWESEVTSLQNTISELQLKLTECEEHHKDNVATKPKPEEDKEKCANFAASLKEQMNELYGNIVSSLNKDEKNVSGINNIIAQNIKFTTLKIIQTFQQMYDIQ